MSRDPVGEEGGRNLYRFVRNSPGQSVDASGTDERPLRAPALDGQADRDEWDELGCGDCPAEAVGDRQRQANQNIIDLIDWATGECHSVREYAAMGKTLATVGKEGYRSPELEKMPACIRKAVEWIETSRLLGAVSLFNTFNLALHPFSETPWCCFGNALAADEANRQKWLYQRLSVVQMRCDRLRSKLALPTTDRTD